MIGVVYIDTVEFVDGSRSEEMRDYVDSNFSEGWAEWRWTDEMVRIPTHRIKSVTTSKE